MLGRRGFEDKVKDWERRVLGLVDAVMLCARRISIRGSAGFSSIGGEKGREKNRAADLCDILLLIVPKECCHD